MTIHFQDVFDNYAYVSPSQAEKEEELQLAKKWMSTETPRDVYLEQTPNYYIRVRITSIEMLLERWSVHYYSLSSVSGKSNIFQPSACSLKKFDQQARTKLPGNYCIYVEGGMTVYGPSLQDKK